MINYHIIDSFKDKSMSCLPRISLNMKKWSAGRQSRSDGNIHFKTFVFLLAFKPVHFHTPERSTGDVSLTYFSEVEQSSLLSFQREIFVPIVFKNTHTQ